MKLKLTKAPTLLLEPNKKYLMLVTPNEYWTDAQKDELRERLKGMGITVEYLPQGTKYKIVEATDEA